MVYKLWKTLYLIEIKQNPGLHCFRIHTNFLFDYTSLRSLKEVHHECTTTILEKMKKEDSAGSGDTSSCFREGVT